MARLSRFIPSSLSSPSTKTSLKRTGDQLGGIVLWVLAAVLAAGFWSYDPLDPSPDVSTDRAATNLLGKPGAFIADILIQSVGLGTSLLVFALIAWGWRIFRHRGLSVFVLRAIALICLMLVSASLLAAGPILITALHAPAWPSDAGIGGGMGFSIASAAIAAGMAAIGPAGGVILWVLGLILAVLLGALAFGLDRNEWNAIARVTGSSVALAARQPGRAARMIIARQRRETYADEPVSSAP
mgnify:FL=1